MRLLCFLLLWLSAGVAQSTILLNVEDPVHGDAVSGVRTIRGWAISDASPINRIEFWVNGVRKKDAPYGAARNDVADANPGYPNADQSGFSFAYNFNRLGSGNHTLLFKAVADDDSRVEISATVSVAAFPTPFISDPAQIMLNTTQAVGLLGNDGIILYGPTVEGTAYDLLLQWRTPDQNIDIVAIAAHEPLPDVPPAVIEANVERSKKPGAPGYTNGFTGWGGQGTIIELDNGQFWQQTGFDFSSYSCLTCDITIYYSANSGGYLAWLWGDNVDPVPVQEIEDGDGGGGFPVIATPIVR